MSQKAAVKPAACGLKTVATVRGSVRCAAALPRAASATDTVDAGTVAALPAPLASRPSSPAASNWYHPRSPAVSIDSSDARRRCSYATTSAAVGRRCLAAASVLARAVEHGHSFCAAACAWQSAPVCRFSPGGSMPCTAVARQKPASAGSGQSLKVKVAPSYCSGAFVHAPTTLA